MKKRRQLRYLAVFLIVALSALYYRFSFGEAIDTVFLTISTFVFSIFTGFFISQQAMRQQTIRNEIAYMNGDVSFVYRSASHLGDVYQHEIGNIIENKYEDVLAKKDWSALFVAKSNFFIDLHDVIERALNDDTIGKTKAAVFTRIEAVLADIQQRRKAIIALLRERIPVAQWVLVYVLMAILVAAISTLPSQGMVLESVLKAGFITSVIFVVVILHRFDQLRFFEDITGVSSAEDALDIIRGTK